MLILETAQKKEEFLSLSYRQLEGKTGIHHPNWSPWFTGKRRPTVKTLELIAEKMDMSLPDLFEVFEERRRRTMGDGDK